MFQLIFLTFLFFTLNKYGKKLQKFLRDKIETKNQTKHILRRYTKKESGF